MPNAQEKKIFGRRFLLNQRKSTEPQVATANDFQGSDASSDCELKPYAIGNEGSLSARIALSGEVPSLSRTSAIVATQLSKITDNGSLWLQAQASDVIQGDRRWWRFMDEFQVVEGLPSIDDVVTKFSALASVEHGRLRKIINKVTEQVRDHKEAGNAITAADPTNATSVIWGCLQVIATVAVNLERNHRASCHGDAIINIKECCAIYSYIYAEYSTIPETRREDIRKHILHLYVNIIKYILTAWDYLRQSKLGHVARGVQKCDQVNRSFESVQQAERLLKERLAIADSHILADVASRSTTSTKELQNLLPMLRSTTDDLGGIKRDLNGKRMTDTLKWVSEIAEGTRLQELLEKHHDGTGNWFLSDRNYLQWRTSLEKPILFLKGAMGTGKSDVVAQVVSQHQNLSGKTNGIHVLCYYFCDRSHMLNSKQLDARSILRCLLKQCLQYTGNNILQEVAQFFEERQLDGRTLTLTETRNLMESCINSADSATLIIDALDECEVEDRAILLSDLKHVREHVTRPFRILVSSRSKPDIEAVMESVEETSRISMNSHEDIQRYANDRVELSLARKILTPALEPYKNEIIEKIVAKAAGMFRWAASALLFLERSVLEVSQTLKRLDVLPPELDQLYSVIYQDVEKYKPEQFEILQKTLSLLIGQRVELSSREIVQAVMRPSWHLTDTESIDQLVGMCADFVDFNASTNRLRLSHASVQDFLLHQTNLGTGAIHARLASMCLGSLSWSLFNAYHTHIIGGSFSAYALCHLIWHISEADPQYHNYWTSKIYDLKAKCKPRTDFYKWLEQIERLSDGDWEYYCGPNSALDSSIQSLDVVIGSSGEQSGHGSAIGVANQDQARYSQCRSSSRSSCGRGPSAASSPLLQRSSFAGRQNRQSDSLSSLIQVGCGSVSSETGSHLLRYDSRDSMGDEKAAEGRTSWPDIMRLVSKDKGLFKLPSIKDMISFESLSVNVTGDFESMTEDLTMSESYAGRRIVRFERNQQHNMIEITCKPTPGQRQAPNAFFMSIIWWDRDYDGLVPAVETIDLLRFILGRELAPRELDRAHYYRDELQLLVNSSDDEQTDFWRKLLGFLNNKYPHVEDNIGIIPWSLNPKFLFIILSKSARVSFSSLKEEESGRSLAVSGIEWDVMDPRKELISVHCSPANPIFAIAAWNISHLLDSVDLDDTELWSQRNIRGQTLLAVALHNRHQTDAFAYLLPKCPQEALHATTTSGKNLLHIACEIDDFDAGRRILALGMDPNVEDGADLTPLYLAISNSNYLLVEMLIDYGAGLENVSDNGLTRIWLTIAGKVMTGIPEDSFRTIKIVELFTIIAPSFLTTYAVHGFNLLHVASTYDNVELATLLIKTGANVNARVGDGSGMTALHIAADHGADKVLKRLLVEQADVDAQDGKGCTPIHYARSWPVVNTLLQYTGSLDRLDNFDRTPLRAALERAATTAVHSLLEFSPFCYNELRHWSMTQCSHWLGTNAEVCFLPFNISRSMSQVLVMYLFSPCVSINAERPISYRIVKAAEQDPVHDDLQTIEEPANCARGVFSNVAESGVKLDFQQDAESEQSIREQRIEEDEEGWPNQLLDSKF